MPVWTAAQLNRFTLQAEELFCEEYKCLIDRVALDIVNGTSLYSLPSNCLDIRRITYKGFKVDPISHRNFRAFFQSPESQGRPTDYIYNNVGQLTIKFFPTPNESITASQTNLFTPSVIAEQAIIEYYVIPDGISAKLPDYLRRRLLKSYVLKQSFSIEGKGQNLKAAKYWSTKWDYLKESYGNQIYDYLTSPRKLILPGLLTDGFNQTPPMAQFPIGKRATGVNPGE